ncbi:MAG: transglutaminase family protein [Chthoniobacterales bacterium]
MQLGLRYESVYRYERVVGFSPHELRLFPRTDRYCRLRRVQLRPNGDARIRYTRDVFDNVVAVCFYPERLRELSFTLELDLDLEAKDAFDFILDRSAENMPFIYKGEIAVVLQPYTRRQTTEPLQIPGWTAPQPNEGLGTVSALVGLNKALFETIEYERREEGAARPPAETLQLRRGACRDVAVLLAEILRGAGLAARLVSGYLREAEMETRRAEGSLHAWTEVFLPGAGWVGMDPTNGVFCNHNFIAAAVGLQPADVTPVSGTYYAPGAVSSAMTARMELLDLSSAAV